MSVIQDRNILKSFFKTGNYPTQEQFELLIDSLVHKHDSISATSINGLTELLNKKADASIAKELQDLLEKIERREIGMTADEREVTYDELKVLRENYDLSVGTWYRITDYETTVFNNSLARAAGHPFDILVLATDVNQLSEDAKAVHSERDTEGYFEYANLAAWKLKYSLDNDTTKFAWAGESGKGVIWGMEDEYNNRCCYDFKNIQFKRSLVTATIPDPSIEECAFYGKYVGQNTGSLSNLPEGYVIDPNDSKYLYTFSVIGEDGTVEDNSMGIDLTSADEGIIHLCAFNRMREAISLSTYRLDLNNNVFVATCNSANEMNNLIQIGNTFGVCCANNTFVDRTMENTFGNECYDNTFGSECYCNTFGDRCCDNQIGKSCYDNTFGNGCDSNIFKYSCWGNTFGNDCCDNTANNYFSYNILGNNCNYNSFGADCRYNIFAGYSDSNTFRYSCSHNIFGVECDSNTLTTYCDYNTFGNDCNGNTLGTDCYCNSFGNECDDNILGASCRYNSFGNDCNGNELLVEVEYSTIFEDVYDVSIGSEDGALYYVQILNGTHGSSEGKLRIDFELAANYTQVAGINSSGELKIWVPADSI